MVTTLKEIEVELKALKQRQGELDANVIKNGVFDGEVLAAQASVEKKIRTLQSRREALLSGEDDPQSTAKLAPQPKPQLRPPRRLTTKKAREAAVEVSKQAERDRVVDAGGNAASRFAHDLRVTRNRGGDRA